MRGFVSNRGKAALLVAIVVGWALPHSGSADPYNRRPPSPPPGPQGPPPVYRPPPGAPVPRVPGGIPNAVRNRGRQDTMDAQRGDSDAESESGSNTAPVDELNDLDSILENWEEVQNTELGNEIMEEWLDNAGSDKSPEEVLRDAIDTVLDRREIDPDKRGAAADAAAEGLWPDSGSGDEDHAHGPDGSELPTETEPPAPVGPVVRINPDQMERVIAEELRDGKSPGEIQQQLDDLNRALGGSGSVPLPEMERVTAPDGQVLILDPDSATRFRDAMAEANRAERDRESAREDIQNLNGEADRWRFWEENVELRTAAGIAGLMETVGQGDAEREALRDRIASLQEEPRPQVIWHHNDAGDWVYAGTGRIEYGGQIYDDWDSAMAQYDRRGRRIDALNDTINATPSDVSRIERQTRTRTGDSQYNPTDPNGGLVRQARDALGSVAGTHTPERRQDTDVMRSTAGPGESGMFNRPAEMLGQIEAERDGRLADFRTATARLQEAQSTMQSLAGGSR